MFLSAIALLQFILVISAAETGGWENVNLSSLSESEIFADLWLDHGSSVCPFDRIQLSFSIMKQVPDLRVAVWNNDVRVASSLPLYLDIHKPTYNGIIQSVLNEEHESPLVTTMAISDLEYTLTVNFDKETNTPEFLTSSALTEALTFLPPLIGPAVGIIGFVVLSTKTFHS
jgi:hypothetical protein